jgi:hypothetical protein
MRLRILGLKMLCLAFIVGPSTYLTGSMPTLGAASSQVALCEPPTHLDKYEYLRRLSLDLRGRLPSYDEYMALDLVEDTPANTYWSNLVDSFLASPGFKKQMRRYHEAKLWPNLGRTNFATNRSRLIPVGDKAINGGAHNRNRLMVFDVNLNKIYRGGTGDSRYQYCGDFEQTQFDPNGSPITQRTITPDECLLNNTQEACTYQQEGWVWVQPYWEDDPTKRVRVCAFDAQNLTHPMSSETTELNCDDPFDRTEKQCGCGAQLKHCFVNTSSSRWNNPELPHLLDMGQLIRDSMREQVLRLVDDVSQGGYAYTEMIQSTRVHENGVLRFYRRHQSMMDFIEPFYRRSTLGEAAVDDLVDWHEPWEAYDNIPNSRHSGVLTLPAFLMRFTTNRARANRARTVFAGQTFQPPGEVPGELKGDDLTKRQNCRGCHETLEPLAAFFSPFLESNFARRTDTDFPIYDPKCISKSDDKHCNNHYITLDNHDFMGVLKSHRFFVEPVETSFGEVSFQLKTLFSLQDTVHERSLLNNQRGPAGFAEDIINDGRFGRASVNAIFQHFMNRPFQSDNSLDNENSLREKLIQDFSQGTASTSVFDLPSLVKTIVTLPQYRSLR